MHAIENARERSGRSGRSSGRGCKRTQELSKKCHGSSWVQPSILRCSGATVALWAFIKLQVNLVMGFKRRDALVWSPLFLSLMTSSPSLQRQFTKTGLLSSARQSVPRVVLISLCCRQINKGAVESLAICLP